MVPLAGVACWLISPALPEQIAIGRLLLVVSALLLFQSLIRDLTLLARAKREAKEQPQKQAVRCMCVESALGATGIVVAVALLGAGIGAPFPMSPVGWTVLVTLCVAVGFLIKDFVFEWSPWRFRRDKDHMNIVFTWKGNSDSP